MYLTEELTFLHEEPSAEEEIIRCVCNIYKDEGLMIMCEKCEIWQHCDCMGVSGDIENYLCELCSPRQVNRVSILVLSIKYDQLLCEAYPKPSPTLPLCYSSKHIFEPTCAHARWALMHRLPSVRLSVCPSVTRK